MSIMSHVSVGTTSEKFPEMIECYDAFMKELGAKRQMTILTDGTHLQTTTIEDMSKLAGVAYGKYYPEFWIQLPHDKNGDPATVGNGTHFAFNCRSAEQVKRVYQAALNNGAVDNGKPGPRPDYSDKYYGGFFKDPYGNRLEAGEFSSYSDFLPGAFAGFVFVSCCRYHCLYLC